MPPAEPIPAAYCPPKTTRLPSPFIVSAELLDTSTPAAYCPFAAMMLSPESVTEESTFESLNIDSLDMVELVCELEDRLSIDLGEFDDSEGIETLGQFVEYVEGL